MGDPFPLIITGNGGIGLYGGTGGRGGDIHLHSHILEPGSFDASLLISLPRANYARYDSAREDAPSSCLEGTRVAVLREIMSWSGSVNGERPPVYWLNGLAGIGKSTIAKTVAERAQEKAFLGATFFFSRSDGPLRDPRLVFPTLAFQLAQSDSTFKDVIVQALREDPTLGHKELLSQFQQLIVTPLLKVNPLRRPTLIILDALDECEEKGAADILRLVFSHAIRIPFLRILITSRPQPHLSSVFNKARNLEKTILHDIEASVIQQDIRFYISTELAKIPEKLDLPMGADWTTETERDSLVDKSGKLFVYAATALRFIGDDRVRDPHRHLRLILNSTRTLQETGATPYSQLDELYMGVLQNSLSSYNRGENVKRFQTVIGSIVLLREPLPLRSLAQFVEYERGVVEASFHHLHSVIVPPSNIHEAPRIYHPSFLEFLMDPSRCSMTEFVIVPVPEQELRHAIRCLELMAKYLRRDMAGISDPSLLNKEVDGLEWKVGDALPLEVQYACRYWASHLSHVELGERKMVGALEGFSMRSILWWFEAMSLIGSVSTAASLIQEAHRWAANSKCKPILVTMLYDAYRFILVHWEGIRESALHVYHSALPFTPQETVLYKTYSKHGKDCIRVLQGAESEWPRSLSTLLGHSSGVTSIAFSPSGLHLASGSYDCTLWLWDAISGRPIARLEGHSSAINTIAFSPDGLHLASGSHDHTLRLWDTTSGVPIAKLEVNSGSVITMAFSPNGLHLASGSHDWAVWLWDAISGVLIAKLEGHSGTVSSVAFSPDGLCLASGSDDCTIQLWDAISGASIAKLKHSHPVTSIAFSPNGLHLASGSTDGTVWLWDAKSGDHIAKLEGHSNWVKSIAFSPNGLCLASGSTDNTLWLWDATSGRPIAKLEGHSDSVVSIAFSPDGLHLASGSHDQTLQLWDATSGAPIAKLQGHSSWVTSVAFSPNGLCLASGSADCTLQLWDAVPGTPIAKQEGHSKWVKSVVFSPDGLHLASGSWDCTIWLWDATSGAPIAKLEGHSHMVTSIAFSPKKLCLASGSGDHTIRLWDAVSGMPIAKLEGHSGSVLSIAFSPDGLCLAAGSTDCSVWLWDAISRKLITKLEHHDVSVNSVAFSPDGFHLASASDDCTLYLWDAISGACIARLEAHSNSVRRMAFSPDGLCVTSTPTGDHHPQDMTLTFSPDSSILSSGPRRDALKWDLTLQPPKPIFSMPSTAHWPFVGLDPPFWSLHGQWLQVELPKNGYIKRICHIPPYCSPSLDIIVSSKLTQPRIAIACKDGRVIILAVPPHLFYLSST